MIHSGSEKGFVSSKDMCTMQHIYSGALCFISGLS